MAENSSQTPTSMEVTSTRAIPATSPDNATRGPSFTMDDGTTTGRQDLHPFVDHADFLFKMGPALLLAPLGVFGNVLALVILQRRPSKESRSTAFFYLVQVLTALDLTIHVTLFPIVIIARGQIVRTGGMGLCKLFAFLTILTVNCQASIVVVMAVERYIASKYPFHYSTMVSRWKLNVVIASAWSACLFTSLLPLMGLGRYVEKWPGTWCFYDDRNGSVGSYIFTTTFASVGILAVLAVVVLNTVVIRHVLRLRQSRINRPHLRQSRFSRFLLGTPRPSPTLERWSRRRLGTEMRMVVFLLTVTIIFAICYTPLMIRMLINQYQNVGMVAEGATGDNLDLLTARLTAINQIMDPWIYIISRFACGQNRLPRSIISSRRSEVGTSLGTITTDKTTDVVSKRTPLSRASKVSQPSELDFLASVNEDAHQEDGQRGSLALEEETTVRINLEKLRSAVDDADM